jgi:pre-mRNA-splicing helicase BRR2
MEGRQEVSLFDASCFAKPKEEGWWLVIGDHKSNRSADYQLCITATKGETKVGFCSTNCFGKQTYTLHVQCMSGM